MLDGKWGRGKRWTHNVGELRLGHQGLSFSADQLLL